MVWQYIREGWRFKVSIVMDFSNSHEYIHKSGGTLCVLYVLILPVSSLTQAPSCCVRAAQYL